MATHTAHFELIKPSTSDRVNVSDINTNSDNIDRIMYDNQQRSEKAISNTADEYSTAESYAVGDIATHEGILYKCISATSGEWNSAKWRETTIAENLGGGGGGTTVVANPTGEPMDYLNTIKIGDMIYGIPTGGGTNTHSVIYSTEERRVGVWIDGKTLYEKTIVISALPSTPYQLTEYAHNIAEINEVCIWHAYMKFSSGTVQQMPSIQFASTGVNTQACAFAQISKTNIAIMVGANLSSSTGIFVMRYTKTTPIYSFHINGNESNPDSMVTYLGDAQYMTPAHMDYSRDVFDYGSWENVWFVRDCKPCILNQDGTVQAYLDKNDYTKDVDGNTVTIDENLTGANVMVEFPKIWLKVTPDNNDDASATISISPIKLDDDYVDYAYIDHKGNHKEHFYMPAYNSSNISNVMRSLSGQAVSSKLNAQTEINYCKANGDGWYTEDAGEVMLINFLLILMAKTTDTQTAYGQGLSDGGSEAVNNGFRTGVHNQKGLFYGTNSGTANIYTNAVKVFGIENWWGFQWRRYAGDILDNGKLKIKLCWGNEDDSTSFDFNTTGEGYVDVGATPSGASGGYISKMKFTKSGMFSVVSSGTSSTFFTDSQWYNNTIVAYALHGGSSDFGLLCGPLCVNRGGAVEVAYWAFGADISYK